MKRWIARDSNGSLFLHNELPTLYKKYGYWDSEDFFRLNNDEFLEVTFENSPQEVELVIKKQDENRH